MEFSDWHCMKCGHSLTVVHTKIPAGEATVCMLCNILYTIHGTGVEGSLFMAGAETFNAEQQLEAGETK